MKEETTTWAQQVENLRKSLGRDPTLNELLLLNSMYNMTPEEIQAQRESWVRGMRPTGDPRFD